MPVYCHTAQDAIDQGWFLTSRCHSSGLTNMEAVLATAQEVALALAALHERGVVHGDLTGYNVLLSSRHSTANRAGRAFCAKVRACMCASGAAGRTAQAPQHVAQHAELLLLTVCASLAFTILHTAAQVPSAQPAPLLPPCCSWRTLASPAGCTTQRCCRPTATAA